MNSAEYRKLDAGEMSLVDWQYDRTGHFFTALWSAISHADSFNQECLAKAFPLHIAAYRKFAYQEGWWPALQERLGL